MKTIIKEIDAICTWINSYCAGFNGCVLGLSGGLDSAVVAALCAKAGINCHALIMPARSSSALDDALLVADALKLKRQIIDISPIITACSQAASLDAAHTTRYSNFCARTRMMLLYDYSAAHDLLVAGTSNLSERMLGYFTIFGDGACAFNPIAEFYKSEVRELAKALGINERIIKKPPSADFYDGQSDEADIGFSYEQIDAALQAIKAGWPLAPEFEAIAKRVRANAFKLEAIATYKRKFL